MYGKFQVVDLKPRISKGDKREGTENNTYAVKGVTCHVTIFAKECVLVGFNISSHTI